MPGTDVRAIGVSIAKYLEKIDCIITAGTVYSTQQQNCAELLGLDVAE